MTHGNHCFSGNLRCSNSNFWAIQKVQLLGPSTSVQYAVRIPQGAGAPEMPKMQSCASSLRRSRVALTKFKVADGTFCCFCFCQKRVEKITYFNFYQLLIPFLCVRFCLFPIIQRKKLPTRIEIPAKPQICLKPCQLMPPAGTSGAPLQHL